MLLVLAFALLARVSTGLSTCLSLARSQGCPGFSREFISTNTTSRFSWYPNDDIAAFDKALNEYVSGLASLEEFQAVFRCPGLDSLGGFSTDHGTSVVRYHRSMVCADILFSEENLNDCYGGNKPADHRRRDLGGDEAGVQLAKVVAASTLGVRPSAPMPLCRSTCNAWIDSLHTIVSNSTLCQVDKGINRGASLDSLRTKCDLVTYGGAQGHCVEGADNEPKTCGNHAAMYASTCASVGVLVEKKEGSGNDASSSDDAQDTRVPVLSTPTSEHKPNGGLLAELQQQTRQERLFRIVAIVLSVVVGVCLIALMVIIGLSRSDAGLSTSRNNGGVYGDSDGANGKDDSTVLYLGTGAHDQDEKGADFVDCFLNTVGKPRQVLRHFFARREDEISLQQGDIVTLQMAFDDGWVVGKNLTTGTEGTFPLMCVIENLPLSLPAQWSVLPESKSASVENLRRPSRNTTRPSPHSSMLGSMSLPSGLDVPMLMANGRGDSLRAGVHRGSEQTNRAPTIVPNGNRGRVGNMTGAPASLPRSTMQTSTRTVPTSKYGYDSDNVLEAQGKTRSRAIMDRLIGAFTLGSDGDPSREESGGFFKRLVSSPLFGTKESTPIRESPKYKSEGRPHSFRVSHVTHVGLNNPNFPRAGDASSSVPTLPAHVPSLNGYPVITGFNSVGNEDSVRQATADTTDAPLGFPRQPNFSYGEFAPSTNSRQLVTANGSMDTYQTAEQSAYSNFGVQPLPVVVDHPH
ncbi:hypothetical protein GGI18_000163 [Coemansia linderi]|uniref:Uncharacterized protein n=1 Tax=Coemansia linderi TaxID=2663919 RepID=A0ACC1KPE9_9FUNG|nr:hypothetical protein GGI18_000163 [Coemansia linderi]